jgi:hypothetical protein
MAYLAERPQNLTKEPQEKPYRGLTRIGKLPKSPKLKNKPRTTEDTKEHGGTPANRRDRDIA